jgi:glycosyltransferase involved in cell wall biosynthesis
VVLHLYLKLLVMLVLLLDPLDSALWSEAIVKFAQDETFRDEQAERGFVRAKSFTWEASARAHVAAYRDALRQWRNRKR